MIWGCISGFNEAPNIHRAIASLRDHVDVIVYVDGAYAHFPHEHPFSTDNTVKLAKAFGADIIIETRKPWVDEIHKRNAYLMAAPGDWYFVLDGDEEFHGVLETDVLEALGLQIMVEEWREPSLGSPNPILRCFRARRGLHYHGTHHALWAGGVLLNNEPCQKLNTGYIRHYHDGRPQARIEAKGTYYRHLQEAEHEFRQIHRL